MNQLITGKKPSVREVLDAATDFLSIDEICKLVYGRTGEREAANVYIAIHRLGQAVEKRAAGYRKRR